MVVNRKKYTKFLEDVDEGRFKYDKDIGKSAS